LAKQKLPVPILAIHAIMLSSGRKGKIDRAFATFQEMKVFFGKTPTLHSFNALLFAAARTNRPSVMNILTVYQDMEMQVSILDLIPYYPPPQFAK
jgi:hypothetical protein